MRRLAAAGLATLFAAGCTSGAPAVPSSPPTRTIANGGGVLVPHLVGIDRAQAEQLVLDRGLYVRIDARGTAGTDVVLAQQPRPDVRIPAHSLLVLTVDCMPISCPPPPAGLTIYDPCSCATR